MSTISKNRFVNGMKDQRMLDAMNLFPQIHDALMLDCKSADVPVKDIITALACQRKGGIYTQDNLARIVNNLRSKYSMVQLKYNDGSEMVIVRRLGGMPNYSSLRSFENNPGLNRCTDLQGCRYFQKHWGHVKKRINKISNNY